jgi:hypothetical protein
VNCYSVVQYATDNSQEAHFSHGCFIEFCGSGPHGNLTLVVQPNLFNEWVVPLVIL